MRKIAQIFVAFSEKLKFKNSNATSHRFGPYSAINTNNVLRELAITSVISMTFIGQNKLFQNTRPYLNFKD